MMSACGTADEGAHLSFTAPADLGAVTQVQIVLASADSAFIETAHQRVGPKQLATEVVTYYRQAASGGTFDAVDMSNRFTIRIAPNPGEFPDTQYIPFALGYDANGVLLGVATYHAADDPTPLPIKIAPGEIDMYTLDVGAVTAADPNGPIAAGQARVVDCNSQSQKLWHSGFAWRPKTGPEVRVLLPDVSDNPAAPDALDRMLDLDCDVHPAADTDCDDTLPRYYRGSDERCDGEDTNCDGLMYWVEPCTSPSGTLCVNPTTNAGVAMCDEAKSTVGACQSDPECLCAANPTACTKCTLSYQSSITVGSVTPCQPALGQLSLQQCTGTCTVDVVAASPGWSITISGDLSATFGPKALNVSNHLYVRAKLLAGPTAAIPGSANTSVGQFHLAISDSSLGNTSTRLTSVALELGGDVVSACPMSNNQVTMTCVP